ncbi:uncharacterized protein LOC134266431 [Saccostrea cucullata]|uniref:uncharacterized protein LOC134266431 n=1 Tax=Saccostrea cuccullata TaxID=36930 RepID=UPI002ED61755
MKNQKLSTIGLIFCLISLTVYIQGISAQTCSDSAVLACVSTYTNAASAAAGDYGKLCSAAHQYLNCLDNVLSACGSQDSTINYAKQYVDLARQALNQYGCGAAGLIFNLLVMVLGLAFTFIFKTFNDHA